MSDHNAHLREDASGPKHIAWCPTCERFVPCARRRGPWKYARHTVPVFAIDYWYEGDLCAASRSPVTPLDLARGAIQESLHANAAQVSAETAEREARAALDRAVRNADNARLRASIAETRMKQLRAALEAP